jgi:hypothetical protein
MQWPLTPSYNDPIMNDPSFWKWMHLNLRQGLSSPRRMTGGDSDPLEVYPAPSTKQNKITISMTENSLQSSTDSVLEDTFSYCMRCREHGRVRESENYQKGAEGVLRSVRDQF